MNVLFLSLLDINSINEENIYMDLLNEFITNKHNVYVVSPSERRKKEKTHLIDSKGCKILKVKTGNIQKTNIIEKGISTILIENQFKHAIKKYFKDIKFDLILYATPPITLCKTISYMKKKDNAKTYLMLKDIFPQNAVDLGMISKSSIIYKFFRKKEKRLYNISDKIGCMSPKNVQYLLEHNSYINKEKVEVLPNTIKIRNNNLFNKDFRKKYRQKYNIPDDARVFIYGGNLGKPQGIDFIIKCLTKVHEISNCYFVICGTGTEYKKLDLFLKEKKYSNVIIINGLSKKEYNEFLNIGDIGMIFLDYKFTIPNFPSRILSYMEKGMPILSCTDTNTDIGDTIEKNNLGWKCWSNNEDNFYNLVKKISTEEIKRRGKNSIKYLEKNWTVDKTLEILERGNGKIKGGV